MSTVQLDRPSRPQTVPGGVASLVDSARPCDGHLAAPAHLRRAPSFDRRASATAWIVSDRLGQQGEPLHRRPPWDHGLGWGATLVVDEGCDVRIAGRVAGAELRRALLEWLPPTPAELAVFEGGLFVDEPEHAVALLVRPPTIWSLRDAVAAERAFPRSDRFDPERFAALERYAMARLRSAHLSRLRRAARLIGRRLPCAGLPVASTSVAAGCSAVADDDALCATVAARQLARYASSARVGAAAATVDGS